GNGSAKEQHHVDRWIRARERNRCEERRRILVLLHGDQHRRGPRPPRDRVRARKLGLPPRIRSRCNWNDRRPRPFCSHRGIFPSEQVRSLALSHALVHVTPSSRPSSPSSPSSSPRRPAFSQQRASPQLPLWSPLSRQRSISV